MNRKQREINTPLEKREFLCYNLPINGAVMVSTELTGLKQQGALMR